MAFTISSGARNGNLDRQLNGGAGINYDSGVLEIRSGAPPGPDAAEAGTLLASITLPADAFAAAASGSAAKSGTWQDASADATGTAGHFRVRRSGDAGGASATAERYEGTITATSGGGDMELDNTSIASGQQVTINTFTLSQPAS